MRTAIRHENNFDLLRLVAALIIIVSHAYALQVGYLAMPAFCPLVLVGYAALAALFTVSGYLIPQSWCAQPDPVRFFWKRSLRVFPGLIAAVLFTLLVVGPIATSLSPAEYLHALLSPGNLSEAPFFEDGSSLGLFTANPITYVNASLWTIPVEFSMYVIVAVFGMAGLLRKKSVLFGLIAANLLLWGIWYADPSLSKIRFTLYFLIGAYLSLHHPNLRYDGGAVFLLLLALVASAATPLFSFVALIAVPYAVLWFAHLPVPALNAFGRHGDFSYGMYIYAYPIQQTIVLFLGTSLSLPVFAALSIILTAPFAVCSWVFIERRALALKQVALAPVRLSRSVRE
ncbi:acyltransferase family protein [Methanofollis fontis]|nr:acyltransferase [Methanofollis fontis]